MPCGLRGREPARRGVTAGIGLPLLHRGKVRDVHEVDAQLLLLVATDRLSAFDVVMNEPVPGKGRVLTLMTAWWLDAHLGDVPHHLVSVRDDEIARAVPALAACRDAWAGRASLVRRTRPLPVECVVRGHLSGSAWKEYRDAGTLAGEPLHANGTLVESDVLPEPIFSPATKARTGHDENITFADACERLGAPLAERVRSRSLEIFRRARAVCARADIVLADTKFEFGVAPDGELLLIDEVLTPDSSRFWPREAYAPGRSQPSLDKQPLRDHLDGLADWDKRPPPPPLPGRVVEAVGERYRGVFERLAGVRLDDYEPPRFGRAAAGLAPGRAAGPAPEPASGPVPARTQAGGAR